MRFAALPQVLSNFVSYALLRFEINVRGAAIMGFVGAGGIGQELIEAIRKFYYTDISAMLLLIIVTVMLIDRSPSACGTADRHGGAVMTSSSARPVCRAGRRRRSLHRIVQDRLATARSCDRRDCWR